MLGTYDHNLQTLATCKGSGGKSHGEPDTGMKG